MAYLRMKLRKFQKTNIKKHYMCKKKSNTFNKN